MLSADGNYLLRGEEVCRYFRPMASTQFKDLKSSSAKAVLFAETQWSLVLRAQERSTPFAIDALEHLCRTYWFPLYGFVRRQGYDPAAAQDLTQDFFARFAHKNCLAHVDRTKGKFRSFLLASLKNFLANERARARAEKRGGCHSIVSLDADEAETRFNAEPFHEATPEKAFDRTWAMTTLENALTQLKQEYAANDRAEIFQALQAYLSGDRDEPGYAAVAARLNTTEAAIKMAVVRLRRRFGQVLRAQVGQTVAGDTELNEELRYLFTALAG
jgi:RNA polymerase sigma-70 factor (ECF subfamily)